MFGASMAGFRNFRGSPTGESLNDQSEHRIAGLTPHARHAQGPHGGGSGGGLVGTASVAAAGFLKSLGLTSFALVGEDGEEL